MTRTFDAADVVEVAASDTVVLSNLDGLADCFSTNWSSDFSLNVLQKTGRYVYIYLDTDAYTHTQRYIPYILL